VTHVTHFRSLLLPFVIPRNLVNQGFIISDHSIIFPHVKRILSIQFFLECSEIGSRSIGCLVSLAMETPISCQDEAVVMTGIRVLSLYDRTAAICYNISLF
jgi:hypothetical protein